MLSPHEVATPLWTKLSEHYEARLAKLRAQLESPRIDEAKHKELAWRIYEIRAFLELENPPVLNTGADAGE